MCSVAAEMCCVCPMFSVAHSSAEEQFLLEYSSRRIEQDAHFKILSRLGNSSVKKKDAHFKLEQDRGSEDTCSEDQDAWESESQDSSGASIDSLADDFSPGETVIIFDWDDTLFPTTALDDTPSGTECDGLQRLVREAKQTLEKAMELSDKVVIVTNATDGWMEQCCEDWFPELIPTLDKLEFMSARSAWEPKGITTPTGWKAAAFDDLIKNFYSRNWQPTWKNVIVIGDACYEHDALQDVISKAPLELIKRCRSKSIRFAPQPTAGMLACELQGLRENLDNLVTQDTCLDLSFFSESL